jgi:hypothetical protein
VPSSRVSAAGLKNMAEASFTEAVAAPAMPSAAAPCSYSA